MEEMNRPLIVAHRGASYLAPENTLAAVRKAWQLDADGVEIDVHLSADGRVMVMHDANTLRTCGVALDISATDSARLRELDAGKFKGAQWQGEPIPFLSEVVATIPDGKFLVVEIKSGPEIISALNRISFNPRKVKFISFDLRVLAALRPLYPESDLFLLFDSEQPTKDLLTEPVEANNSPSISTSKKQTRFPDSGDGLARQLLNVVRATGLDGLDVNASFPVDAALVRAIHDQGKQIYFWTVDDPARAEFLSEAGADALTTNRPGWLRQRLNDSTNQKEAKE